ncbi:hypothetical protein QP933_06925 [Corynebacterium pseudodiphtheriticum]|uniref:hypothetical protein n=1 Tax=Corynebacterium pseudodiphtheriticum TaxID=37637 RepID=UPI00254C5582|nr:hypothetical protein [Corynebacterium pseudodiphtheriticum]MDK8500672.1 hypothetical protein [Corynebacterium pseudodiphtheriticum]MDK8577235.1 hypothetical protein [Corynebacterium pseudodiphtheriticum]MDK8775768.1 hypothetical protein [Corynebacterium pseudodiphtheriticum]
MKRLERWIEQQYEQKMNVLLELDNHRPGQPGHGKRNYILGQVAAYADVLDMLELFGQEE